MAKSDLFWYGFFTGVLTTTLSILVVLPFFEIETLKEDFEELKKPRIEIHKIYLEVFQGDTLLIYNPEIKNH